jgi:hypothetical protein
MRQHARGWDDTRFGGVRRRGSPKAACRPDRRRPLARRLPADAPGGNDGRIGDRDNRTRDLFDVLHEGSLVHHDIVYQVHYRLTGDIGGVVDNRQVERRRFDERLDERFEERALIHEAEIARRQVDGQVHGARIEGLRRQRRPANVTVARAPGDQGRAPIVTGHPHPTVARIIDPAAVMIGRPAERLFRDPEPAILGHFPMPDSIGSPGSADADRNPDPAVISAQHPAAIRRQLGKEDPEIGLAVVRELREARVRYLGVPVGWSRGPVRCPRVRIGGWR